MSEAPPEGSHPPPEVAAVEEAAASLPAVPDDAGDMRGHHFSRLIRKPATLILGGILVIGGGAAGAAAVSPGVGAAVAGGALAFVLLVVYLIARSAAEGDFFVAYANGRNLKWTSGKTPLPPTTPLLQRGDNRYATQRLDGLLPGGVDGTLALYTYEEETRDSDGNRQTSYFHYTIATTQLPDTAPFMRELFCNRRFGFRFLDSAEDAFRKRQRVEHESDEVDKRYEIFCGSDDDLNRARQILSPSFLVWLADHSPEKYAFELVAGSLVANVKGHKKSAAELDELCTASAAVARRLREEATE